MSSNLNRNAAQGAASAAAHAAKRLVIKVGSAILCGPDGVREAWLSTLAADIVELRAGGVEIVVVTSGAIAIGRNRLGLKGALRLDEKQAASAAGQAALAQGWQAAFTPHDIAIAQVLLTLEDTENRRRYLNARATLRTLLGLGALPLVNENDTIATSEIRYGDNDRLAAHAAQLVESDLLVILSDIDGLYTADPRKDGSAKHIPLVEAITPEIERAAGGVNQSAGVGSGGMASKVAAAKIAGGAGCDTVIAPGLVDHPLKAVLDGGPATLFRASITHEGARRQWIAGRLKPSGRIVIDDGAAKALENGASLLPAGVKDVEGAFARGDAVEIVTLDGQSIGQGLIAFDAGDARKIAGAKSDRIEALLGYRRRPAMVEKDDLILRSE
ncbi:glutamate 5-kinase [Hyphococcus luteus]|uniref:Glutamate 5-kinase n=1 Tax=Hyphococcus luteus TaxID=2058213 RepID=A0A2S7JZB0_9PROT|nr:glutamate 5-kinase [Marinicaulis flavus]PQA85556.1 glutamate 5-kinase [Marinicaulis flavus]